jgi:DNA-binding LacI/PurR family transcriptional regulator
MAGLPVKASSIQRLENDDQQQVRQILDREHPDGFVCANDRTAGRLMHSLIALGVEVPREARIVGIDDIAYASLLPVPLTTMHQPCREIGMAAMSMMLERLRRPDMPVRDVLLESRLVIRNSCGAKHQPKRMKR